jgi:hypothetical protein
MGRNSSGLEQPGSCITTAKRHAHTRIHPTTSVQST